MRSPSKLLLLSCILVFTICGSVKAAFDPMKIPPLADYVVDYTSGVLAPSQIQDLDKSAQDIQTQTTAQVAAVLIPTH